MRPYSLLIILIIFGACSYISSLFSPTTSRTIDFEKTPAGVSEIHFVQATPTPTMVLTDESGEAKNKDEKRAFEDGLPLAARVNDQPIFLDTYEKRVTQFEQALKAQGVDLTSEEGQVRLVQIQQRVLEGLLDQLIIEQQAHKLGISITKEEVEAQAQDSIAQIQSQVRFEEWLINNHLNYQEFIADLRSQLIASQVFEHVTNNVPETADQIRLRYLRVADQATAQAMIERLKNGISFTTLIQEHPLDEHGQASGGDLDWFPRKVGVVPTEVATVAFTLQIGEVSGPIPTPAGFYIIKLEDRELDRSLTQDMIQTLKKQIFADWLIKQRSSTVIERYVAL